MYKCMYEMNDCTCYRKGRRMLNHSYTLFPNLHDRKKVSSQVFSNLSNCPSLQCRIVVKKNMSKSNYFSEKTTISHCQKSLTHSHFIICKRHKSPLHLTHYGWEERQTHTSQSTS